MNTLYLKKTASNFTLATIFVSAVALVSCGGGGDSVETTTFNTAYSGNNNEAVIDEAFVNEIVKLSGNTSAMLGVNNNIATTTAKVSNSNCLSGNAALTATTDPASGESVNTVVYSNCVGSNGTTLNGTVAKTSLIDKVNPEKTHLKTVYTNYTIKTDFDNKEFNGYFDSLGTKNKTVTEDLVVKDKILNESIYTRDSIRKIVTSNTESSETLSSTLYYSKYGFVSFNTSSGSPIIIDANAFTPRSGQYVISGKSTFGGDASITITYTDVNGYTIKAYFNSFNEPSVVKNCTWNQGCN